MPQQSCENHKRLLIESINYKTIGETAVTFTQTLADSRLFRQVSLKHHKFR